MTPNQVAILKIMRDHGCDLIRTVDWKSHHAGRWRLVRCDDGTASKVKVHARTAQALYDNGFITVEGRIKRVAPAEPGLNCKEGASVLTYRLTEKAK